MTTAATFVISKIYEYNRHRCTICMIIDSERKHFSQSVELLLLILYYQTIINSSMLFPFNLIFFFRACEMISSGPVSPYSQPYTEYYIKLY